MKFVLQVSLSPYQYQASNSAYRFASAAAAKGHFITRVFFYHDGVYNANALIAPPQDEINLMEQWKQLTNSDGSPIDKVICVASALRRGVMDEENAQPLKLHANIAAGFRIGGLGELIEAIAESERLLVFG